MQHLFLINPAAGKVDRTFECSQKIHEVCKARKLDYRIRVSKARGDITAWAREAAASGQETRIYACGGDGTLNEAVNGAACASNVAVTHWPGGSGNDFIKIFSDPAAFRDLEALIDGEETSFDLIRCGDRYAINICSVGIDARIGTDVISYKRLPLVTGSGAYLISAAVNFARGIAEPYTVEINGENISGDMSLVCVCSGRWYGGGFNPVPEAEPDDGVLDVLIAKGVSRLQVPQLLGPYKAGRYREFPEMFRYFRTDAVTIRCGKDTVINLDGESKFEKEITFRVIPKGMRFFYPQGLTYHTEKK